MEHFMIAILQDLTPKRVCDPEARVTPKRVTPKRSAKRCELGTFDSY